MPGLKKLISNLFIRPLRLIIHKGNTYICPFCGYASKDLRPVGQDAPVYSEKRIIPPGRRKGGCYKCGSIDRERLIYLFLKQKLQIFDGRKNLKILHIAPEKNVAEIILRSGFEEYVCGDLFAEGYTYPSWVRNMNVLDIPFGDNTFDLVLCNHVFEHIPNDTDAMKEILRVLKPGGKAMMQIPLSLILRETYEDCSIVKPEDRIRSFGHFDHVRIYGQDYPGRLEKAGFIVSRFNVSKEFSKYGVIPEEDIFIGEKPL